MSDTSGSASFDAFCAERFVLRDGRVVMLPDTLPGKFSVGMTPEQAEYLAGVLYRLAGQARRERAANCPLLYPEDVT